MITEIRFGDMRQAPLELNNTATVYIRDRLGNPLVVVFERGDKAVVVTLANEEKFTEVLQHLGINERADTIRMDL